MIQRQFALDLRTKELLKGFFCPRDCGLVLGITKKCALSMALKSSVKKTCRIVCFLSGKVLTITTSLYLRRSNFDGLDVCFTAKS